MPQWAQECWRNYYYYAHTPPYHATSPRGAQALQSPNSVFRFLFLLIKCLHQAKGRRLLSKKLFATNPESFTTIQRHLHRARLLACSRKARERMKGMARAIGGRAVEPDRSSAETCCNPAEEKQKNSRRHRVSTACYTYTAHMPNTYRR